MPGRTPTTAFEAVSLASNFGATQELSEAVTPTSWRLEFDALSLALAHDLRAPLRGMDGFAQALLEDYASRLDAEGMDHLREIQHSAHVMNALIEAFLEFTQVSQVEVARDSIDLTRMLQDVADAQRGREPARDIEVRVQRDLHAHADPRLVQRLLEKLFANAWKCTQKTDQPAIQLGAELDAHGMPVFYVRDNGVGFDLAYAHKLFVPFQRLHASREISGAGMGLAIARRIVQKHGGRIWADAQLNHGATFYFTLPSDSALTAAGPSNSQP
jgi:light-regulated signal transduction histidine kinase (bacteriophytochrome)